MRGQNRPRRRRDNARCGCSAVKNRWRRRVRRHAASCTHQSKLPHAPGTEVFIFKLRGVYLCHCSSPMATSTRNRSIGNDHHSRRASDPTRQASATARRGHSRRCRRLSARTMETRLPRPRRARQRHRNQRHVLDLLRGGEWLRCSVDSGAGDVPQIRERFPDHGGQAGRSEDAAGGVRGEGSTQPGLPRRA